MSFLDLDEWLLELAAHVDVVFSPLADVKAYPEQVDVALVEGAIANEDHVELIRQVRQRTKMIIAFGDCAVTGNVTALRNPLGGAALVLQRVYGQPDDLRAQIPSEPGIVPRLLDRVVPVHSMVRVEVYLPGCPPPAARIRVVLAQVLAGETPWLAGRDMLKFG
jgi:NAD-reducing hydrogenase small subunit